MQLASRYNAYIEPLQILIYLPTLLIFALLLRGTKQDTSRGVLLLLGAEWAMVGVLFAFVAGALILNVLKEELPSERKNRFWAFGLGAIVYSVLMLLVE